jgi:hypothetical protein
MYIELLIDLVGTEFIGMQIIDCIEKVVGSAIYAEF